MLPTKPTAPKKDLASQIVLIHGRPKLGKCVRGDTKILDPTTGRPTTISEIVRGQGSSVLTMKEAGVIVSQKPSGYFQNEPAQLFRLVTQTGREIQATTNHPFLLRNGWKALGDIEIGDRVAVVAEYPSMFATTRTDDDLLKILAYLIADGGIASGSSPVFTKNDPEVRMDFEDAVEAKGDECIEYVNDKGCVHVRIRGKRGSANNVIAYLKEVGLHGLKSSEKFIPEFVFGLRKEKLALFLNRLFTCDGSMEATHRVSYSSTSIRMVNQIQHLLSRFGIVSVIREKYLNGELYGAELLIGSRTNVLSFIDQIGFFGEKAVRAEMARAALYNIRSAETQLDRLGNVLFDRVVSIEPTIIEETFDLTIDGSHNFIANDFVVHNSTWCSKIPNVLFIPTEPGLGSLEIYKACEGACISSWQEFLTICAELKKGEHPFKSIAIDTVDNLYMRCAQFVCERKGVEHESDLEYGKGSALVNREFSRVLTALASLGYGLYLVSHTQDKEVETRAGKILKAVPQLPNKAREALLAYVDIIVYADLEISRDPDNQTIRYDRVLRTKPGATYEAGDRTGRLPDVLPLDFAAFAAAFEDGSKEEKVPATKVPPTAKKPEGKEVKP